MLNVIFKQASEFILTAVENMGFISWKQNILLTISNMGFSTPFLLSLGYDRAKSALLQCLKDIEMQSQMAEITSCASNKLYVHLAPSFLNLPKISG